MHAGDLWILFSLASAFLQASRIVVTKKLSLDFSSQALTFYTNLASLVLTLPLISRFHDFPLHNPHYLGAVLAGALFSGLGGWAFTYAIKHSDISIVGPVMTFTPGFVVLIEWLILGDVPSPTGLFGLGLLITGGYILNLRRTDRHLWLPLQRLIQNRGSRFALIATACFASAATFGRSAIQLSDPYSFAVTVAIVNPIMLFLLFSIQAPGFQRELTGRAARDNIGKLLLLGALFASMRLADQIALSMTLASYATGVKRMSGVFTVLLGMWLFKERSIKPRLLGSLVMIGGVYALTLVH